MKTLEQRIQDHLVSLVYEPHDTKIGKSLKNLELANELFLLKEKQKRLIKELKQFITKTQTERELELVLEQINKTESLLITLEERFKLYNTEETNDKN